jgi:hypothetical protein
VSDRDLPHVSVMTARRGTCIVTPARLAGVMRALPMQDFSNAVPTIGLVLLAAARDAWLAILSPRRHK